MARPNDAGAISRHVTGLREAKAAFMRLPEVARDNMNGAVETTVREIARGAKARLLASPSIVTRNLYNHVRWSVTKTNGRGKVGISAGSTTITVGGRSVKVKGIITAGTGGSALKSMGARKDSPARRAHFIEFGKHDKHEAKAEPFMIPSAEAQRAPYLARCRQAGKGIERDLRSGGGLL